MNLPLNNFLLHIGSFNIYLYGFGLFVALIVGFFLVWRELKTTSFNEEQIIDTTFSFLFLSLFVGRLIYVLLYWPDFHGNLLMAIQVYVYPGINEFFGWLTFFTLWLWYANKQKLDFLGIVKLLIIPIFTIKLVLAIFSLLITLKLNFILEIVIYIALLYITRFLLLERLKQQKIEEKNFYFLLVMLFAISQFILEFFSSDKFFILNQTIISLDHMFYLFVIIISLLVKFIKIKN